MGLADPDPLTHSVVHCSLPGQNSTAVIASSNHLRLKWAVYLKLCSSS